MLPRTGTVGNVQSAIVLEGGSSFAAVVERFRSIYFVRLFAHVLHTFGTPASHDSTLLGHLRLTVGSPFLSGPDGLARDRALPPALLRRPHLRVALAVLDDTNARPAAGRGLSLCRPRRRREPRATLPAAHSASPTAPSQRQAPR